MTGRIDKESYTYYNKFQPKHIRNDKYCVYVKKILINGGNLNSSPRQSFSNNVPSYKF